MFFRRIGFIVPTSTNPTPVNFLWNSENEASQVDPLDVEEEIVNLDESRDGHRTDMSERDKDSVVQSLDEFEETVYTQEQGEEEDIGIQHRSGNVGLE